MDNNFYAIYLRISKDDDNIDESNSIKNQRKIIEEYVKNKVDFEQMEKLEFIDDGVSGTSFKRPEFNKMMELVFQKKISCIIIKDLSRFGRDYIDAGKYIEQIFPLLGIRFISVNDNYDSLKSADVNINIQIKNMLNNLYSVDISQKIKKSLESKRLKGGHMGPSYPYGYKKISGEGNKLFVDEDAAKVVKRIFILSSMGENNVSIARTLNNENIPSPKAYKNIKKGINENKDLYWNNNSIRDILRNIEYTGTSVSGKYYKPFIGDKNSRLKDRSKWVITKNVHEPIISEELYNRVQKNIVHKKLDFTKKNYLFSGLLYCGWCGHRLKVSNKTKVAYYCDYSKYKESLGCKKDLIYEDVIEEIIYKVINCFLEILLKLNCENNDYSKSTMGYKLLEKEIINKNKQIEQYKKDIFFLYDSFKDEKISKIIFLNKKEDINNKINKIDEMVKEMRLKLSENNELSDDKYISKLNNEALTFIIKKIIVFSPQKIEIQLNCSEF